MAIFLFICCSVSLITLFLIIYAFTLPFFPDEWRSKVNSNPQSLNPRYNNESITGIVIILFSAVALIGWISYLYLYLF